MIVGMIHIEMSCEKCGQRKTMYVSGARVSATSDNVPCYCGIWRLEIAGRARREPFQPMGHKEVRIEIECSATQKPRAP